MNEAFTDLPKFYPWDTPQFMDTLCQQLLLETSTDKKLSGEPFLRLKESLKEKRLTPQLQKELDMYHRMDMSLIENHRLENMNES
jgi:hypothetical protein